MEQYNCDLILHFIFWFLKRCKKSLEAKPRAGRTTVNNGYRFSRSQGTGYRCGCVLVIAIQCCASKAT
uniref:Uncharacterized protein n=1 Tax=Aegilops tauschii TaxID=37682 RepID=M8BGA6_AEGTA